MIDDQILIEDVSGVLNDVSADYVIAGGYPRDLFLNAMRPATEPAIVPKDIDFHVYNLPHGVDALLRKLRDNGFHIDEYGIGASEGADVEHVVKLKNHNVDIIIYRSVITSIRDVLDTFDWNINQFMLINGLPTTTADLTVLEQTHPMTDEGRYMKAIERHRQFKEWGNYNTGKCTSKF